MDPVKLLFNASEDRRVQLLGKWERFGVLNYSHSYMVSYFPGQEDKAKELGFILEDNADEVDIIGKNDESKEQQRDDLDWLF